MASFSWYIHGLWILGAVFMFLAAMIAGNIEWVEGTTFWSYWLAILISFSMFLLAGVCWISSGANSIREETFHCACSHCICSDMHCKHHHKEEKYDKDVHKREV